MRTPKSPWDWHDSIMKRENHPALLQPGEGLSKMAAAGKKEQELKLAAHRATAALKEYQITNPGKPKAPIKKAAK